jgi:hypothetical protein
MDRNFKPAVQIVKHPASYACPKCLLFNEVILLKHIPYRSPGVIHQFGGDSDALFYQDIDYDLA